MSYRNSVLALAAAVIVANCAPASANMSLPASMIRASWYGGGEKLSRHTSTGEVFNPNGHTAASRTLPFGTRVRVCFRGCTIVRISDRGPAAWTGRSLDIARAAAADIGLLSPGSAPVSIQIVR